METIFTWISKGEDNKKSYSILLHFFIRNFPTLDSKSDSIISLLSAPSNNLALAAISLIFLFLPMDKIAHQYSIIQYCWSSTHSKIYLLSLLLSVLTENSVTLRRILGEEICVVMPNELLYRLCSNVSVLLRPHYSGSVTLDVLLSLPPPFSPLDAVKKTLAEEYSSWIVLYIFQELLKKFNKTACTSELRNTIKSVFLQLLSNYPCSSDIIKLIDEYIGFLFRHLAALKPSETKHMQAAISESIAELRITEQELAQIPVSTRKKTLVYYILKYNAETIKHTLNPKLRPQKNAIPNSHSQSFIDSFAHYNIIEQTWGDSSDYTQVIALACTCAAELPVVTFATQVSSSAAELVDELNSMMETIDAGSSDSERVIRTWLGKLQLYGYKWARGFLVLLASRFEYKEPNYSLERYVVHPCCCAGFSHEAYSNPIVGRILTEIIEVCIAKYERYAELSVAFLDVPERNIGTLTSTIVTFDIE
eukprot:TRINITY_DN8790_c0_g1_i13.p1 TRINITY_DN8790_c0_g1~~TRINITY_DN8790_c0_g1_i13.p1  ORF type:complete len:478 (+),score=58.84 TRINITY_DN8790_c0_g1_i13:352-1785(+)